MVAGVNEELAVLQGVTICRVSTVPFFLVSQLKGQVEYLRDIGMDVVLVSSAGHELRSMEFGDNLQHCTVEIPRSLKPWQDLKALFKLIALFRQHSFQIVHSTTPKAGLLCALAGLVAKVPVRLHTFTGQPWITLTGPMRWLSRTADKVLARFNTHCYADSPSQCGFLVDEKIAMPDTLSVIGQGSLAGVDMRRFDPARWSAEEKDALLRQLGINSTSKIITFIGRITGDKGIHELLEAFKQIRAAGPDVELLLLGPLDQDCGGDDSFGQAAMNSEDGIHYLGYVSEPERYLSISDIFCLPSYREGFGTVVIEAAAMGVPTVGTRVNGLVDAVQDGVTGVLVPVGDARALEDELQTLISNPDLTKSMGKNARKRCEELFAADKMYRLVALEYVRLLNEL